MAGPESEIDSAAQAAEAGSGTASLLLAVGVGAERQVRIEEVRLREFQADAAIERRPAGVCPRRARTAQEVQVAVLSVGTRLLLSAIPHAEIEPMMFALGNRDARPDLRRLLLRVERLDIDACKVVIMTSRADFFGNLGCGSIGIPRPLSVTDKKPPASNSTEITLAWPATASSIALSITSANR